MDLRFWAVLGAFFSVAANAQTWPSVEKQAAFDGCRLSIQTAAENGYLQRMFKPSPFFCCRKSVVASNAAALRPWASSTA